MKLVFILFAITYSNLASCQSFDEEKTSLINYIKRMYKSSPFEGTKLIEGDQGSHYIAAVSLVNSEGSPALNNSLAEKKAQEAAKKSFAEPCVKFEMLSILNEITPEVTTYLFSFQPLSEFIKLAYKKQAFNGAKIITTPICNYFVSVVSLDPRKYTAESLMDRVALIKAKQQANTLFNGSTIGSEIIIRTDEDAKVITSFELIREQSFGFVEGLESLLKYTENQNKVYVFYRELINK